MNKDLIDKFDAADQLCAELSWYAMRKINLAETEINLNNKSWADLMLDEVNELQEIIAGIRKAVTVSGSRYAED